MIGPRVEGRFTDFMFLPPANEVWGKVIFVHLSVILFTVGVPGLGVVLGGTWFQGGLLPVEGGAWSRGGGILAGDLPPDG